MFRSPSAATDIAELLQYRTDALAAGKRAREHGDHAAAAGARKAVQEIQALLRQRGWEG